MSRGTSRPWSLPSMILNCFRELASGISSLAVMRCGRDSCGVIPARVAVAD